VVRGESGVGKRALLDYAAQSAAGLRVARVAAVEPEMALGFAALHQLLIPFLPGLEGLPAPQRRALDSAFGLAAGSAPDRFLVSLAALTLLAQAALDQPLLVVIDDAQWLDQESAEVLTFVGRRLYADGIAILFAVRDPADSDVLFEGLPELRLRGLPETQADELLRSAVAGQLDNRVAARVVADLGGNPLALLELAGELTAEQLAGRAALPDPLPAGPQLQTRYLRRVRVLPAATQTLLLLVAAEAAGDAVQVWQAAAELRIGAQAAVPAEAAGLLVVGPRLSFRHPLVRSAVYHGATGEQRRRVHEALAAVADPERDPERRAWHRAAAALGPDESVAAELARSAERARARGGLPASAVFLSRAAELTPDEGRQAGRLLAAAQAELAAGAPGKAEGLLAQASTFHRDPLASARALRLRGEISYALGQLDEAPAVLLSAARELAPLDAEEARDTLLEALQAALYAGRLSRSGGGQGASEIAAAASALPPVGPSQVVVADELLAGFGARLGRGHAAAVPHFRRGVSSFIADQPAEELLRWAMLGCLAAGELWDSEAQYALASRWVQVARQQAALTVLPVALNYLGWYEVMCGRFAAAEVLLAEEREILAATGNKGVVGAPGAGELLAGVWHGTEPAARSAAAAYARDSTQRGQGAGLTHARSALAVLELGLGQYQAALASALDVYREDLVYLGTLTLPDLVEAAVRAGELDAAAAGLDRLAERALAAGTPWARGLLARSRALLADDAHADAYYQEAIGLLRQCRMAPDLARGQLLYGEWLRRQRRRLDARTQLRDACDAFDSMGAPGFAARAWRELRATGEHARQRRAEIRDQLTPQESQIAAAVAEGGSNLEIAAQLFISSSTVDYHLRKVFRKLGVGSRTQLARALAQQPETAAAPSQR
jgi:DNA-binding CsgD family transcriptional regulator